jgi:Flp pilus assembly protein TadG
MKAPLSADVSTDAPTSQLHHRDRGSAAVEATLLAPLLMLLVLLVVGSGRLVQSQLRVQDAAHSGARAASLARDPATATRAGKAAARAALANGGASCTRADVAVNTSGFSAGGSVTVTVSCAVSLSDLSGLRIGGDTTTQSATFTSVVDTWRGTTLGLPTTTGADSSATRDVQRFPAATGPL